VVKVGRGTEAGDAPAWQGDEGEYREYSGDEQRSQAGCSGRRMQPEFHHGLLGGKERFRRADLASPWMLGHP
jgi:hypothetical protein